MRNIGIQLYMVRHALRRDFLGVLEQLAAIGYRGVEFFGDFGGYAPQVLRAHLAAIGLTPIGGHCRIEDVQGDALQRTLEHFAALGASYVGVGWVPERFRTAEGWREAARIMERAGQAAQRYGLTFYYHNHDFEFERLDGHYAIDILFGAADPTFLKAELDTYWVKRGGEDPVAYIRKCAGRVPLLHLKDISADPTNPRDMILGEGALDFGAILAAGDAAGVHWYIVEMDHCPEGELESAARSYANLAARGWLQA